MGILLSELGKLVFQVTSIRLGEIRDWEKRMFSAPSPSHIKEICTQAEWQPYSIWVETGTFQGDTTQYLADTAKFVHSVEPEPALFKRHRAIQIHAKRSTSFGLSENVLPVLLKELTGDVNFWLDGTTPGGITHKSPLETPIVQELETIERHRERFAPLTVMIDDIRCFQPHIPEYSSYPDLEFIVSWARRNNLKWHIEQDIFIAKG
jgi:hypothetical protein